MIRNLYILKSRTSLKKDGNYKVVGYAKNGEDGLKKYFDLKPDVTTLDIIMPGMDGIETAKR